MAKYDLIPEQLAYEGTIHWEQLFRPESIAREVLELTHTPEYIDRLGNGNVTAKEMRRIGFPYSPELVLREELIVQGTVLAACFALEDGVAFNVAGGTHHAYADRGEGFCLYNDIGVAANTLLAEGKINQALVVDLDVHQGNGTASIFGNEPRVFTFSMHGGNNFPAHKEQSDRDVPLPDGTKDELYLATLREQLQDLLPGLKPDIVFYQCGVDVLATDKLGRLGLTMDGCRQRDRLVLKLCRQAGVPVVCVMGGGYSADVRIVVEAHCNTYRLASMMY